MQNVFVVVSPSGFIWGVFANQDAAEAEAAKHSGHARITHEPVITKKPVRIAISTYAAELATHETGLPVSIKPMVKKWEEVCNDKDFRNDSHSFYIDCSTTTESGKLRDKKFVVRHPRTLNIMTASKTLEGAVKLAQKMAF